MSFRFNWNFLNINELYDHVKVSLTESIAQAKRPPMLVEPLKVVGIDFGDDPPELAFHSIPFVSERRTHLVFKLKYSGNASIRLHTMLQVNPLVEPFNDAQWPTFVRPHVIAATSDLVTPFELSLYSLDLDTLVDVVYTAVGVTVSFRNNPLKNVEAKSSLDDIPGVQEIITEALKKTLAESFYEDIPEGIWKATSKIHAFPDPTRGSRRWSQHKIRKVQFRELGTAFTYSVPTLRPFDTLSLKAKIPHAIMSRVQLTANSKPATTYGTYGAYEKLSPKDVAKHVSQVSDLFDYRAKTPDYSTCSTPVLAPISPGSTSSGSPYGDKPRRKHRKISIRRMTALLPKDSMGDLSHTDLPPSPSSNFGPRLDEDTAIEFSPQHASNYKKTSISYRRYSSPGPDAFNHKKLRTVSLQPTVKPRLSSDILARQS